jgi:hypothetical protein
MRRREADPITQGEIAVPHRQEHRNLRGELVEKVPAFRVAREDGGLDHRLIDAGVPLARLYAALGAPVLMSDPRGGSDVVARHDEPLRALRR